MKRWLVLLLGFLLCLALVACGGEPTASTFEGPSVTEYILNLCLVFGVIPLLRIAAGGVLLVAANHLSKQEGNQTMAANVKIFGLTVCAFTLIRWMDSLRELIQILWP